MPSTGTMLFKRPSILCAEAHRDYALTGEKNFGFANGSIVVPLGFDEIQFAAAHYPIVFLDNGDIVPVALMGMGTENEFVMKDGRWRPGCYVPQVFQYYPFALEKVADQEEAILILDLASDRITSNVRADASGRLFDNEGEPTGLLRDIATLGAQMYHGRIKAMELAKSLQVANVLEPSIVQFSNGTRTSPDMGRLYAINAHAYRSLMSETITNWFRSAWLDVISVIFLSQQAWSRSVVQKGL